MTGTPTMIGARYALVRKLGEGGMAEVWLATDERLNGRFVAVKRLLGYRAGGTDAPEQVERARREAYAVSGLHHPNIVSITDFLIEQGEPVIVMEYVEGRTLHDLRGLPPERAAWLGAQVAAALTEAHARGLLHRDVKPANVLVTDRDEAKLADFGIARLESDPRLTATGMFTGTVRYLAPEILAGQPATPASDVWSLGVTLYETVEGRPAFDGSTHVALISAIAVGEVPRITSAPALAPLVDRMLERDPGRRPTAAAAAGELRALVGTAVAVAGPPPFMPAHGSPRPAFDPAAATHVPGRSAVPGGSAAAGGPRPPRKKRSRGWILVAAPVAVVLAAAGIVAGVTSGGDDPPPLAGNQLPTGALSTPTATNSRPGVGAPPATTSPSDSSSATGSTAPGDTVTFEGVRVGNARSLSRTPAVTSSSTTGPAALRTLDLVRGAGPAATPTSTVTVRYVGVLYRNGTVFDSSFARGEPATFALPQTVRGFRQGIGGTAGVAPMRVGGRRLMILPAALGYGSTGNGAIPPDAPLVFVVDLVRVT